MLDKRMLFGKKIERRLAGWLIVASMLPLHKESRSIGNYLNEAF